MIDVHIHIDFYDSPATIIKEIIREDISAILVTHLPELYDKQKNIVEGYANINLAVGFHPILANEYEFKEETFINALNTTKFIGEVGLDYLVAKSEKSRIMQEIIFEKICSYSNDRILLVHSRHADNDVLDLLIKYKVENVIFHWYTGPKDMISYILEAGYYFSLNLSMLRSEKGRRILNEIPLDRTLIEIDGAFVKYNVNIVGPIYMKEIYSEFEKIYRIDGLDAIVYGNMLDIIG